MKIQSFIFTWHNKIKGDYYNNAIKFEKELSSLSNKVTVINSSENKYDLPNWINLSNDSYFTDQWNCAINNFDSDILFHIQADIQFDNFKKLFQTAVSTYKKYKWGIYQPNIDWTYWQYKNRDNLLSLSKNLYCVPQTDCTCWFIDKSILKDFPLISSKTIKYGWHIDSLCVIRSRIFKKPVIRDYNFTVNHEKFTGYDNIIAKQEYEKFVKCLNNEEKSELDKMMEEFRLAN